MDTLGGVRRHAGLPQAAGRLRGTGVRLLVVFCLSTLACFFAVRRSSANPFDNFGLGSRSAAMGAAMTAVADDFSASL